ncbi:MAG TPA: hypothetical protein PLV92_07710 [Pirellulaceae bacterium]|nr:hypothetical protein [Pirellulaceae bacterium]
MPESLRRLTAWTLATLLAALATLEPRLHDCLAPSSGCAGGCVACPRADTPADHHDSHDCGGHSGGSRSSEPRTRRSRRDTPPSLDDRMSLDFDRAAVQAGHDSAECVVCRYLQSRPTIALSVVTLESAPYCGSPMLLTFARPLSPVSRRVSIRGPPV